jgi:hypothetical protein
MGLRWRRTPPDGDQDRAGRCRVFDARIAGGLSGSCGLISSIGPGRAAEFNGLVRQAQAALSGVGTVYQIDVLMEYDSVVTLISRLTILKTIIDHATGRQWLGYRD